jgi:YfiH family protein
VNELSLPGARVFFSTRRGGVSEGPYESLNLGVLTDDQPERVFENRGRLADRAGLDTAGVAMGWQEHGTELREWDGPPDADFGAPAADLPHVDGHLTSAEDVGLLVLVADCLPVALASDDGRIAMLHCGWRPLAGGIVEKAVAAFESPPAAAVGPGIGGCCYEVGPEVAERFADVPGAVEGRMLDLRRVIVARLQAAGVGSIEHVDRCTSCEAELYFSHRRDRGLTGRQGGLCVLSG